MHSLLIEKIRSIVNLGDLLLLRNELLEEQRRIERDPIKRSDLEDHKWRDLFYAIEFLGTEIAIYQKRGVTLSKIVGPEDGEAAAEKKKEEIIDSEPTSK